MWVLIVLLSFRLFYMCWLVLFQCYFNGCVGVWFCCGCIVYACGLPCVSFVGLLLLVCFVLCDVVVGGCWFAVVGWWVV